MVLDCMLSPGRHESGSVSSPCSGMVSGRMRTDSGHLTESSAACAAAEKFSLCLLLQQVTIVSTKSFRVRHCSADHDIAVATGPALPEKNAAQACLQLCQRSIML